MAPEGALNRQATFFGPLHDGGGADAKLLCHLGRCHERALDGFGHE